MGGLDGWVTQTDRGESSFQSIRNAMQGGDKRVASAPSVSPSSFMPPQPDANVIKCFTDGSSIGNSGPAHLRKAGYACVFPDYRDHSFAAKLDGERTNNRAELMAVIKALDIADEIDPGRKTLLFIYTDSELVINSATKWLMGWKRHGWRKSDGKGVMNKDLLIMLDERMQKRRMTMKHVRAHTGGKDWESIWNNAADKLAQSAARL